MICENLMGNRLLVRQEEHKWAILLQSMAKNAYDGSVIRGKRSRRDCEGHRRAVSCQANYLTLIYSLTKPVVAGMRERDGAVSAAEG